MMISFRFLLTILICLFYAQLNAEDASENSLDRFLSEKSALIKEAIKFTEQEQNAFWPLYDDYTNDLIKRYHRRSALVKKILKEKEPITDEQAGAVIDEHFELVSERLKAKKEILAKLRKRKIPETKTLKFFQIEEKMQATFFYLLATNIPMIK
jgi:nucleoid DNA-binding protein